MEARPGALSHQRDRTYFLGIDPFQGFQNEIRCLVLRDLPALRVDTAGPGGGTVASLPTGIDCGRDCIEGYTPGTQVLLTATPETGSTFTGWTEDPDCADGTVTMQSSRSCMANFAIQTLPLTVALAGHGTGTVTSSPAGIACGTDCTEAYDFGTVVTLTATPGTNSAFAGWSGEADCNDGTVTMQTARTCVRPSTRSSSPCR